MGTRHLIIVKKDNEIKVAQYGQWDGYPSGQGVDVLKFLRNKKRIKRLSNKLKIVRFYDEEGKDKKFIDGYNKRCGNGFKENDKRTDEDKKWFETYLSRDLSTNVLYNIMESKDKEILLANQYDFGRESLFCEWAYLIDLDSKTLEVFEGYNKNKKAQDKRFFVEQGLDSEGNYFGVRLVKTYNFDILPTNKQFLADFDD
jgi:hypothetical protein